MEYPQAYCEKWRISRKPHKCCECGGIIFYKERYHYCSGVWDGQGQSYKTCVDCNEFRNLINSTNSYEDGAALGELREYIMSDYFLPDITKFVSIWDKRGVFVRPKIREWIRRGKII
jgi:hypothetical protein